VDARTRIDIRFNCSKTNRQFFEKTEKIHWSSEVHISNSPVAVDLNFISKDETPNGSQSICDILVELYFIFSYINWTDC
jgi:hypothetical protein